MLVLAEFWSRKPERRNTALRPGFEAFLEMGSPRDSVWFLEAPTVRESETIDRNDSVNKGMFICFYA